MKEPFDELETFVEDSNSDSILDSPQLLEGESNHLEFTDYDRQEISSPTGNGLNTNVKVILNLITSKPISFDNICINSGFAAKEVSTSLALLELESHIKALPGNRYMTNSVTSNMSINSRCDQILSESSRKLKGYLMESEEFVKSVHQGVSLKYLQNYLALSACFRYRERWNCGKLFQTCFASKSISGSNIRAIESPGLVRIIAA